MPLLTADLRNHPNRARRSHALLGTLVLKKMSSIRVSTIEFFVNPEQYVLQNWNVLRYETVRINEQMDLPNDFNERGDGDNIGLDDGVDYECVDAE